MKVVDVPTERTVIPVHDGLLVDINKSDELNIWLRDHEGNWWLYMLDTGCHNRWGGPTPCPDRFSGLDACDVVLEIEKDVHRSEPVLNGGERK